GIEDLLDRRVEPVDLVDEEHVALFEIREQRREIARLGDHRTRGRAEVDAELARDDLRERGLAESRRTDEQHVVERFLARPRRRDERREVGARLLLADELDELLRPQRGFRRVLVAALGRNQLASLRAHHRPDPRTYLFGSSSAMVATVGSSPFGTITRASAS